MKLRDKFREGASIITFPILARPTVAGPPTVPVTSWFILKFVQIKSSQILKTFDRLKHSIRKDWSIQFGEIEVPQKN